MVLAAAMLACSTPSGRPDAPIGSDAAPLDAPAMDDVGTDDPDGGDPDGGDPDAGELDAGSFDAPLAVDAPARDAGRDAPLDAGPPSVVGTYRVWVWNVAGNLIHSGDTDTGLIDAAASSIVTRDADFVAFDELCRSQYRALQDALIARGWPADDTNFARFSASRPGGTTICNGTEYGNAIFSRRPLGAAEQFTLPTDGSAEDRTMLCAPLASRSHLRFCTTHISTSNARAADGVAHNIRQLRAVLDHLEDYSAAGDTVLIGGDFNAHQLCAPRVFVPVTRLRLSGIGFLGNPRDRMA